MKKLGIVFAVVFGMCLLTSCDDLVNKVTSANSVEDLFNSFKKVPLNDASSLKSSNEDYFVGDWYLVNPNAFDTYGVKLDGKIRINIKFDSENYVLTVYMPKGEWFSLPTNPKSGEAIFQKKNKLLLLSIDSKSSVRYDVNSRHIMWNDGSLKIIELYKNGDPN